MPKANHGGATAAGYEGIVRDSHDRPSELDPSRNVDGTVVDGYESDERDLTDRKEGEPAKDATADGPVVTEDAPIEDESAEDAREEVASSPGASSRASRGSNAKSAPRN